VIALFSHINKICSEIICARFTTSKKVAVSHYGGKKTMHYAAAFKSLDYLPVEVLIWRGQSHLLRFCMRLVIIIEGNSNADTCKSDGLPPRLSIFLHPDPFSPFLKERGVFAPPILSIIQMPIAMIPTR
jgi:hypothetical protein